MNKLTIQVCCKEAYRLIENGLVFDYKLCPFCGAQIEIIKLY